MKPGDFALRFRVEWRAGLDGRARPVVVGTQTVRILTVARDGLCRWTNFRQSRFRPGRAFVGVSEARSLLPLSALDRLGRECATTQEAAAEPVGAIAP